MDRPGPGRFVRRTNAVILMTTLWACAAPVSQLPIAGAPIAPQRCPSAPQAPAVWTKEPDYRQLSISAHSYDAVPTPKLTLANLRLYQGGKQLQIVFLQPQPVTIGILVDNSGSMLPKLPPNQGCFDRLYPRPQS